MSQLCVVSGQDYAKSVGLHLRTTARDDDAMQRIPLFRSLEGAMSFAFLWRACPGVKIGQIGEYTAADGGALVLSTNEKKAQAGMILEVIASHLSNDQRAVLDAYYGGEQGERHSGVERLMFRLESINRNRALVRMLLMREFIYGERYCPSQNAIARECGVSVGTASSVAVRLLEEVATLRESAFAKLRPAFAARGWIESNAD